MNPMPISYTIRELDGAASDRFAISMAPYMIQKGAHNALRSTALGNLGGSICRGHMLAFPIPLRETNIDVQ